MREVKVTGNEVLLNYTMPILPDNVILEKDRVLPTARNGGLSCTIHRTFELSFSLTT